MGMFNLCLGLVFEMIISLCLHFGIHQSVCGWLCSWVFDPVSESEITFSIKPLSLSHTHARIHLKDSVGASFKGRVIKSSTDLNSVLTFFNSRNICSLLELCMCVYVCVWMHTQSLRCL